MPFHPAPVAGPAAVAVAAAVVVVAEVAEVAVEPLRVRAAVIQVKV
jgi:hypothetical protein